MCRENRSYVTYCFGVEKVNNREYKSIDYSENDISLVADGREGYGGNHDNHEVECPVC